MSDGNEGVQWNIRVCTGTREAQLGVNREGKKYNNWPITTFLLAEIENPVNNKRKGQSIKPPVWISPVKPISDFAAIINKEVPIASFISSPANNTSAGMIRNPPPAPTKPVNVPTAISSIMITG